MTYLSRAVMQGSSQAAPRLFELGKRFYKERKYGPALHCFQALADKGHGRSSLLLGEIYEHGYGVMPNLQKAFDCYAAAYHSGVPQGAYQAGRMMTPDALRSEEIRDIAISWYKEAIAGGIYKAYAEIGKLYQDHGRNEKPGNPPKMTGRPCPGSCGALSMEITSAENWQGMHLSGQGDGSECETGTGALCPGLS